MQDSHDRQDDQQPLRQVMQKYWGFDRFLPLQAEAMDHVLCGRDSVVVLPTGGGKSLCFQAPALCRTGMAVVVSPLIALMKDQVDSLRNCGVPAAFINSSLTGAQRRNVSDDIRNGKVKLLYVAPERLVAPGFLTFLKKASLSLIAIDEAHCISAWGHDFRPEYRALHVLRSEFPDVGIHAFTATASEHVRTDIARQLELRDPAILVGSFDRPNLVYRVQRRHGGLAQLKAVLDRHRGESGIIYCITRKRVDQVSSELQKAGYLTLPYHAGMSDEQRKANQEAFVEDRADTIVATVAFGMGIDKPNVRYVAHFGMPKSLENYQQESGRAGRDGLEAECCLFYSGQDYGIWKSLIENADHGSDDGALRSLGAMLTFCSGVCCRHQSIVSYFGQELGQDQCDACDVCLGELDLVDEPMLLSQKILSCVMRLQQGFGGDYTAKVLHGGKEQRIIDRGHDRLSTWGLLRDESVRTIRDWIEQLVGQKFLVKTGDYGVLHVTESGWDVLRGDATPRLLRPKRTPARSKSSVASWDGVDRSLFDRLRQLRSELAADQGVPAYIVFGDASLREMARDRPTTATALQRVKGVGEKKLASYGETFLACINDYCLNND